VVKEVMSNSPPYAISAISNPPTEEETLQYKQLRLSGLRTQPQFFGSNFEREAAFTDDAWKARLSASGKATFISSLTRKGSTHEHANGVVDTLVERESGSGEQWVGTVTVLGPTFLEELYRNEELFELRNRTLYTIVGVWVEPAFRRKGMAGGLMQAALSWVREDTQHGRGDTPKAVVLRVHRSNAAAREAYLRNGFQDLAESVRNGDPNDEVWMAHDVDPSLRDAHPTGDA
jgi:GNAT superfamily N-acetyltransferase